MLRYFHLNVIIALVIALILPHCAAEQIPIAANIGDSWQPALQNIHADTSEPLFCFVVRTYWGHGGAHGGGLRRLLRSLQRQQYSRWEAVLLVADSRPFPDLHHILLDLNDTRAWVFAEWVSFKPKMKKYTACRLIIFKMNKEFTRFFLSILLKVGSEFAPKQPNGAWAPHYHGLLYNLTDDAIQVCPPETRWLVVTNGDNEYGKSFITRVLKESSSHNPSSQLHLLEEENGSTKKQLAVLPPPSQQQPDIIAFDFYSRFQRITMPACDRFASQSTPSASLCKRNHLKWCQTDLGGAALNYPRFREENRKFGDIVDHDPFQRLLGADSADGVMMETLVYDGWTAAHVTDTCLFVHAPSIQSCAWEGGVWDDRDLIKISGGRCLTPVEADTILQEDFNNSKKNGGGMIEEVRIDVSSDGLVSSEFEGISEKEDGGGDSDGGSGSSSDVLKQVRCLRRKDYKEKHVLGLTQVWYSEWCVDKEDEMEFKKVFTEFFKTEEEIEAGQEAAQQHAESGD
jgi:hypothetical protein